MKHLSEDELIELYYGEASGGASAHEQACRECSARFAELRQSLDAIRSAPTARRGADYGERVWKTLRPGLIPYKKPANPRAWGHWRAALLSLGCVPLLAGAFAGGRYWERITAKKVNVARSAGREATQRIVLVVLADHLDRSERLLVALEHADPSDRAETAQLQSAAQQLLASNRLYCATASSADDPLLAGALNQLEGLLAEVANNPNLTSADLRRLRNEMNAEGILFEVRVLITDRPDQAGRPNHAKGASIS
ncbi:MAG: hypothetical protein WBW84_23190 [Acidobacteriaceae bacterium]